MGELVVRFYRFSATEHNIKKKRQCMNFIKNVIHLSSRLADMKDIKSTGIFKTIILAVLELGELLAHFRKFLASGQTITKKRRAG